MLSRGGLEPQYVSQTGLTIIRLNFLFLALEYAWSENGNAQGKVKYLPLLLERNSLRFVSPALARMNCKHPQKQMVSYILTLTQ